MATPLSDTNVTFCIYHYISRWDCSGLCRKMDASYATKVHSANTDHRADYWDSSRIHCNWRWWGIRADMLR